MNIEPEVVERLEITIKKPNPVFEKWLEKWLQQAVARNSKSQYKLREALSALRSYPLPLACGRECAILRGFGSKLCNLIDNELKLEHEKATKSVNYTQLHQDTVEEIVRSVQKCRKRKKIVRDGAAKELNMRAKQSNDVTDDQVTMSPGSFRILLLVDTQETSGRKNRAFDQTHNYLESLGVAFEVRRLAVGDFLWIARDCHGNELVLPYIVERKRMDDLASSIRDGRFHEQKYRLKNSKIQHVIYLIENYGDNEHIGLPLENLLQACVNTQICNGMIVKQVENHWRSMLYLKTMTTALINLCKDKVLIGTSKEYLRPFEPTNHIVGLMRFRELHMDSSRNAAVTVREVFIQQLLQLHSLSLDKALAIVSKYTTPRSLLNTYTACENENEARLLLAGLKFGTMQRKIGEKISNVIYDFYMNEF